MDVLEIPATIGPLDRNQIETRLKSCPRLPSLGTINSALRELLTSDRRYTSQISEVIRRDPSLTARLLRLVNSVYFGLSTPVNSIEEAVFYLGVRQIRQLAMVTPVIEDFQKLAGKFWQTGMTEMVRDFSKQAFLKSLQVYIPELDMTDLLPGPSGVRAQALGPDGALVDDFVFNTQGNRIVHVRNAPSPGATSSLAIGRMIADTAVQTFGLEMALP